MYDFFRGIQGQENALNLLEELYTNKRIPHALLFTGIEGIGKFYSAIQFLKLLNKDAPDNVLQKIEKLQEPFVKLITPLPRGKSETNNDLPTAKLSTEVLDEINNELTLKSDNPYHKIDIKNANNIKINSIREINKIVSLNFDEISYRGILILDSHKMSVEAQNAFLKNLEEPPEGIVYILISSDPSKLLSTIKSRCWEINFSPLDSSSVENILTNSFNLNAESITPVLPFSQGSVTKALYLIQNNFNDYLGKTILILRYSLARKYHTALKEFSNIVSAGSIMAYQIVIDLIITWLNDTIKNKYSTGKINFDNYLDTIEKFNKKFSYVEIDKLVSKLIELRNAPLKNVSLNLLVMNVIFEIAAIGIERK